MGRGFGSPGSPDPYATFISAMPPYSVLGTIVFAGAGGLDQPLWDAALGKFWIIRFRALPAASPRLCALSPTR